MNEIEKVTTIQDAITWFELDLKDGKCYDTCPQCNANEFALAALREQAEREKGCEYCLQGEDLAYGLDSMHRTGRIYIDGNLLTADLYSESMAVVICYCPVCGKRLEVEP
jgi:hypothetical protein